MPTLAPTPTTGTTGQMPDGEIIRRRRHDLGWTQVRLCEELGRDPTAYQTTISAIERGAKQVSPLMRTRFMEVLGVDLPRRS